ncbi:MAG: TPM domain-containing protein [Bacteroidetes bacterium]|nr:TPM domain-containing protein [Bacteroidota bacterium]
MKNTLPLLLLFLILGCSSTSTREIVFVFDNEQILTEEQETIFTKLFQKHEKETTNEIVLVTTPDWGEAENALLFAVDFGNKLGIGKKEKDNGVVIVFSKQQRETRISTGYGTENVLKDEIAKRFIDSLMIPRFKEGKFFDGLYDGSKAIVDFLEQSGNEIKTGANTRL